MSELYQTVRAQTEQVLLELLEAANLRPGSIFVIGCSTSEVAGGVIGKNCSAEAADAIFDAVKPILDARGIYLAAQCCEHLNRALVVERGCAEKYNLTEVCVKPQPHAGGSWATRAYAGADDPVMVESIQAHAGLDIGLTLIGMHLRPVAVPVRTSRKTIGSAVITAARTRPKLIGGERAKYPD